MDDESLKDPWLTLAEVADELNVRPVTVRAWIAGGRLEGMRAGERWLVHRSELERLLAIADPRQRRAVPGPPEAAAPATAGPAAAGPAAAGSGAAGFEAVAAEAAVFARDAVDLLRRADREWQEALRASEDAPPDAGFAGRLRTLAAASERRALALDALAGAGVIDWPRRRAPEQTHLTHELRPGGNRPGPPALWEAFDRAVAETVTALQGDRVIEVADAFARLAEAAYEIAEAVERRRTAG
ncbi:MAG: helix-turn-helix domain-containing protein [Solirubrobacterales bacterium]|nr:helix-turn-helix domain-containing protein [Solirubrobacterales bacterium]